MRRSLRVALIFPACAAMLACGEGNGVRASDAPPPTLESALDDATTRDASAGLDTRREIARHAAAEAHLCALAPEGSTLALHCLGGEVIRSVDFVSYGADLGSCERPRATPCDAPIARAQVECRCLGRASCEIPVDAAELGAPCGRVTKRLLVVASCGAAVDAPRPREGCALDVGACRLDGQACERAMFTSEWTCACGRLSLVCPPGDGAREACTCRRADLDMTPVPLEWCADPAMACPSPTRNCGGWCVDTASDARHCGACDHACAIDWTCSDGLCCPPGRANCGGECVDLATDVRHCGACDHACPSGCGSFGACACPAACPGDCVDGRCCAKGAACGACTERALGALVPQSVPVDDGGDEAFADRLASSCGPRAPEQLFTFRAREAGAYDFEIANGAPSDRVYVLDARCEELACDARHVTLALATGQTVHPVVEGERGGTLSITARPAGR